MITDKMLEENTTPWGLLSEEMKEAFHKCDEFEHYNCQGFWCSYNRGQIFANSIIRKKPAPLTKPVIPWDVIKDEFKWAARDEIGSIWVYERKPELKVPVGEWISRACHRVLGFELRVDPGTCDWKDSLVERPK